ncbi:MAG: Ig-like domain-containing protein, partial [Oscillospiraceae bacterium]|nr:Ig-like domain-containing protein [Oscillospiraceae bacterium]
MKKILSFFLAIAMVISLLPAVSAGDEALASYTYSFGNGSWIERGHPETGVRSIKSANSSFTTPALTNTEWAYLGSSFVTPASNNAAAATDPRRNFVVGNHKSGVRAVAGTKGEWVAFKVEVPENGDYTAAVKALQCNKATSDLDIYLFPENTKVSVGNCSNANLVDVFGDSSVYGTFEAVKDDSDAIVGCVRKNAQNFEKFVFADNLNADDYKVIGNADLYAETEATNDVSGASSKSLTLDAGVYVILLVTNEAGEVYINSLTLNEVPAKKALTDIEASFGENTYVGEKLAPKVKWFSGDEETDGTLGIVTVEIAENGNPDGALLAGTDGNIYAIAEGTATVKVTGTLDGVSVSKEKTVDVIAENRWANANQAYMFTIKGHSDMTVNQGITVDDTTAGRDITEEEFNSYAYLDYGKVRPWGMVSAVARGRPGRKYFTQYSTGMELCGLIGDWVAFKVKIPAAGKYNIDLSGAVQKIAGRAEIYMLPYENTMNFSSVRANIDTYTTDENFVAEADLYSTTKETVRLKNIGEFVADDSLDYSNGYAEYLMIVKTCLSKKAPDPNKYRLEIEGIYFTGSPAASPAVVTFPEANIAPGESTSVSLAETGSDGASDAYVYHMLLEDGEAVLLQSAAGDEFTALSEGTATVKSYIIFGGSVYTFENVITVSDDAALKAAYIYPKDRYEIGEDVAVDVRLEQVDRKVVSGGVVKSFELVSNPDNAVSLSVDGTALTAENVGSAEVKAVISARGKTFESDIVTVNVVETSVSGDNVKEAKLTAETSVITLGGEAITPAVKFYDKSGGEIAYEPENIQKITWSSSDETVATVSETGEISGVSDGKADITAIITYGGTRFSATFSVTVEDDSGVDLSCGVNASYEDTIYVYGRTNIELSVIMNSGKTVKIPYEYITWSFADEAMSEIVDVSDNGSVYGTALGKAVITPVINPEWKNIGEVSVSPVEINVVWDASINPQIFTVADRENAKANAKKYSWAKSTRDKAIAKADTYVTNLDRIYNMAAPEGLPRFYYPGQRYDPLNNFCRYCGEDLTLKYSKYGFSSEALSREWKIQCPECKRLFPSNDFGKFFELGMTESKKLWSYELALQKHHEMFVCESVKAGGECTCARPIDSAPEPGSIAWNENDPRNAEWYAFYGYGVEGGYLNNDLYEEMDEKLGVRGWAVDDGFGYRQPYISKETAAEKGVPGYDPRYIDKGGYAWYKDGSRTGPVLYTYAANFAFEGIWQAKGTNSAVMKSALKSLREAFLYTGDAKYGRAGAILLDKWADLYPYFEWAKWRTFRTDSYLGTVCDPVDATYLAVELAESYDAFLPIYNDPYVVEYLSKSAPQYEMNGDGSWKRDENGNLIPVNLKDSPGALRKNVEDNILLEIFNGVKHGRVIGNFGLHHSAVVTAAIVLDREPETGEMIDWAMRYGTGKVYNSATVGNPEPNNTGAFAINHLLTAVDRDGNGNENSTQYNKFWVQYLLDVSEKLYKYTSQPGKEQYKRYNLLDNPKFVKMFTAIPRLTLGGYYSPQMGDSDGTATATTNVVLDDCVAGFKYTGNRMLARVIYQENDNSVDGLHTSIYDAEPEKIKEDIKKIVDEDGGFSLESDLLSGFGFAALRAGAMNESANAATETNTQRDFALYFGMTNGHGHRDTLNLYMSAFGLNIAPDLGYPKATGTD